MQEMRTILVPAPVTRCCGTFETDAEEGSAEGSRHKGENITEGATR